MEKYTTKVMNHLGIVAGICNEINLIKNIDTFIPAPTDDNFPKIIELNFPVYSITREWS